jgi:hypothetical protein
MQFNESHVIYGARERILLRLEAIRIELKFRVFKAQANWSFLLPSELPTNELRHLPRKMPPQAAGISNATRGRFSNSTPRQLSKLIFSQLRCRVLPNVCGSNMIL